MKLLAAGVTTRILIASAGLLYCFLGEGDAAEARLVYQASQNLPFSGGDPSQFMGDFAFAGTSVGAIYSRPAGASLNLMFYRFGPNAETLAERQYGPAGTNFYEPSICWDGKNFAVVAATYTQSMFMLLSPAGEIVQGPLQLPGLGTGADVGRTAAFEVLWTGQGYAVFGLWLEKQFPLQDLTAGNFYTHLHYWLLSPAGQVVTHRELRLLAPMAYPGIAAAEKLYYDVAWTGQRFFLAYHSESEAGPPFSVYYRLFDLEGNAVRAEAPVFANQVAQGAKLAWNGRTVGVTALKAISMPSPAAGNYMYVRCFDAEGNPQAVETEYGQRLGFGPTIFWAEDVLMTAYVVMYDMGSLTYALMLNSFSETGQKLGNEYPLANSKGAVLPGRMSLGVDLQFTPGGTVIYGKAQTSDAWGLSLTPFVFTLRNDALKPVLQIARNGDAVRLTWPDTEPVYKLMETPSLAAPVWTGVAGAPLIANDQCTLTVPMAGARFFRLGN